MAPREEFDRLAADSSCGAFPSAEMFERRSVRIGFDIVWRNHEEARKWAFEVLRDRTTFAADGSQLFIEREISFPVAAVQIGWFENDHRSDASYTKNARFVLFSPEDLLSADEPAIPETRVSERRFHEEIETVSAFLLRKAGWRERNERMPLAFYDGTLFLSIAPERTQLQSQMIGKLVELVRLSETTHVPLIGFVDRSYARDLMALADEFGGSRGPTVRTIDDVSVLHLTEPGGWGDRTPFFYCRRRGLDPFFDPKRGESIAGFVYLRTTSANPSARIDLPAWIADEGLLDEVLDVVRAECVVGLGYPYAIETADQTAVISLRDREVFLAALQGFANENGLDFQVSRKAASKGRRR